MTYRSSYKKGAWLAVCDICGWKYKSTQLRERWDKLMACKACWEPRHPMDFFKAPKEEIGVPWTRIEPSPQWVPLNDYEDYINWVNVFNEGLPNWEVMREV